MRSVVRTMFASIVATAALAVVASPPAAAGSIDCARIGTAYDGLFSAANKRVQDVLAEFKALGSGASPQQREAVRRKFCIAGGETIGLYKFVRALANDCASQGDNMRELQGVIEKQIALAERGVSSGCE